MHSTTALQFSHWWEAALSFLYPNLCQICQDKRATAQEGYVCQECRSARGAISWIRPPLCQRCGLPYAGAITTEFECANCREITFYFSYARAAAAARGLVLEVVHRYKYQRALWFEPFLAGLLIQQAEPVLRAGKWDCVVPVPLHPLKQREREFNQAERMARALAAATALPVQTHWLQRAVATRTQTLLSRMERAANVGNAFRFCGDRPLRGERIVLVDDVFTTGATVNACAKLLRRNGSGEVCVWTVARGL
jgi:competence protein ComFC